MGLPDLKAESQKEKVYKLQRWAYLANYSLNKLDPSYLKAKLPNLDAISITGYKLSKTGKLRIPASRKLNEIISMARANGIKILPLITFTSVKEGRVLLKSKGATRHAINEIAKLISNADFSGIHLDFEYLSPEYIHKLALFLKDLRKVIRGKRFTMAIFPQVDFPEKWARFHDLSIIGQYLDEIVIMCYDYHCPKTAPGPVVDIEWSERNIKFALRYLRPEQVWLGIPAYGYFWSKDGKTRVIPARNGIIEARKQQGRRHPSGTIFYQKNNGQAYLADSETRGKLESLARRYHLRGVALWRLGFEESDYWR